MDVKKVVKVVAVIFGVVVVLALVVVANAVYTPGSQSDEALGQKLVKDYNPNESWVSQDQAAEPGKSDSLADGSQSASNGTLTAPGSLPVTLVGSKYQHVFNATSDLVFLFNSTDSVRVVDTLSYPSVNEDCRVYKTSNAAEGDFVIEHSKFYHNNDKYTKDAWSCNYSGGLLVVKHAIARYSNSSDEYPRVVDIDPEAIVMNRQNNQ